VHGRVAEFKDTAIEPHPNTLKVNNNGHGWSSKTVRRLVKLRTDMRRVRVNHTIPI
jgi:pyridoxine 5'-phosphate synthase PdxJ